MTTSTTGSIDLSFRPSSYWKPMTIEEQAISKITGHVRRALAAEYLEKTGTIPSDLLEPLDETRHHVSPVLLGGEFLPEHEAGEVEIARISLDSTTLDQVVVRARKVGARIRYSVHDEYDGEYVNPDFRPCSSNKPLTLRQLVNLIGSAYDVYDVIDMNIDGGADVKDMATFVTVSSAFYPQLEDLYRRWIREYLASKYPPDDAEDEEADEGDENEDEELEP